MCGLKPIHGLLPRVVVGISGIFPGSSWGTDGWLDTTYRQMHWLKGVASLTIVYFSLCGLNRTVVDLLLCSKNCCVNVVV